jgi:hypothetical protein
MKLLGISFDLKTVIVSMVIGFLLCSHLFCSCVTQEGLDTAGSVLDHVMSKGVHSDKYEKIHTPYETTLGPSVPLPEGQLFMYANNDYKADCCKFSSTSSSNGCLCPTKEQINYVNSRGGNSTHPSKF